MTLKKWEQLKQIINKVANEALRKKKLHNLKKKGIYTWPKELETQIIEMKVLLKIHLTTKSGYLLIIRGNKQKWNDYAGRCIDMDRITLLLKLKII